MTFLGDFGVAREEHSGSFGYFGAVIRVHPDFSEVAVFDMFALVTEGISGADEDPAKIVAALRAVASVLVHPDDVEEFWQRAKANRQTMDDIGQLAMQLMAALADRPTERPSDSSDGPRPTAHSSEDDSSSRALRVLDGRPDLAVAVLRAQEERSA